MISSIRIYLGSINHATETWIAAGCSVILNLQQVIALSMGLHSLTLTFTRSQPRQTFPKMTKFFIVLALSVLVGVTQAWFDELKPQNNYEMLHAKLMAAAKKLSEESAKSGNLRPEAASTASSYVVQQSWSASTTCSGSPSFSTSIGLGQCYSLTTGYGRATAAGNTVTGKHACFKTFYTVHCRPNFVGPNFPQMLKK